MVEDFRLYLRTFRPLLALPVLIVAAIGAVVLITADRGGDDGLVALRTDAPSTSVASAEPGTVDLAAPELAGSSANRDPLIVESPSALGNDDADLGPVGDESANASSTTTTGANSDEASSTSVPSTTTTGSSTTGVSTTAAPTTQPSTTPDPTTAPETTLPAGTTSSTAGSSSCQSGGEFERVFRDDFNGDSLGSAWRQYDSIGNNGFGLRRPSANSVSNGQFVITAEMQGGQVVSGGIAHNYDQMYGKYVFRVRTGHDPTLAMSGVVLTWPESQVHPRDGENNIYETLRYTAERNPFYSVIHKPFGQKGDQELLIHSADGSVFQTMTMEWRPDGITIIRQGADPNDNEVFVVAETDQDLIPDNPHHVTIQLDAWKHQIDGPVLLEVDFIEVYKYCG